MKQKITTIVYTLFVMGLVWCCNIYLFIYFLYVNSQFLMRMFRYINDNCLLYIINSALITWMNNRSGLTLQSYVQYSKHV